MVDWVNGFIIPLIEIVFIGGLILWVGYYVFKGLWNAWSKQTKFFFRYKMPFIKKSYPESTLKWCLDCIDQGIGYYDAKKMLMIKMLPDDQVNETMYIYDQILNEMKGGLKTNGRGFKASDSEDQGKTELPTISSSN